jgi:hypothetical protein
VTLSDTRRALVSMTAAHRHDDLMAQAILDEIGHDVPALQRLVMELAAAAADLASDYYGEDLAPCLAACIADAAAEEVGCAPMGGL